MPAGCATCQVEGQPGRDLENYSPLCQIPFPDMVEDGIRGEQLLLDALREALGNLVLVLWNQSQPARHLALLGLEQHLDGQKVSEIVHFTGDSNDKTGAELGIIASGPVIQEAEDECCEEEGAPEVAVPFGEINIHQSVSSWSGPLRKSPISVSAS